jgi:hypothetical protein
VSVTPDKSWIGLRVEAQYRGEWAPGKIISIDTVPTEDDLDYFEVQMDSDKASVWRGFAHVRIPAAHAPIEFRRITGEGATAVAGNWETLNVSPLTIPNITVYASTKTVRIEFRTKPKHTDSETMAKLRDHVRNNPGMWSVALQRLIAGEW